ncbi:hypothetical protein [Streptomyces sp. KL2]|uniref:hypothetical protein n=1 Tax=Streptomyces sp. KL2 TaxID=3050126 RepID=UPI003979971C
MTQRPVGLVFPGPGRPRQAMGGPRNGPLSRDVTAGIPRAAGEDLPEPLLRTPAGGLRRAGPAQLPMYAGAVTVPCGAVRGGAPGGPAAACAGRRLGGYAALAAGVANAAARPYGGDRTGAAARRLTSPAGRGRNVRAHTGPLGGSRAGLIRRTAPDIEAVSGDGPGALD